MAELPDDLFPPAEGPRPGAAPRRKCSHPRQHRTADGCGRCGHVFDAARQRVGRGARRRGTADELTVARILGGRKVGHHGGPHDVELEGYMRIQAKRLAAWPSVAQIVLWLDGMQPGGDVRAVSLALATGRGVKARRLLIVDLEEYARWHGRTES